MDRLQPCATARRALRHGPFTTAARLATGRVALLALGLLALSAALRPALAGDVSQLSEDERYEYRNVLHTGGTYLASGDTARALARFKQAAKLAPEEADPYFWIGLCYAELQDHRTAAQNAEKALTHDDTDAKAWLLLGQSQMHMADYDRALETLRKAFRLDPRNYLIPFNLGRCYYFSKHEDRLRQATKYFKQAYTLNPRYIPARLYLGICELDANMPLAAVSHLRAVLTTDRNEAIGHSDEALIEAYYRLGVAFRQRSVRDAERQFKLVTRYRPKHYEAHLQLGHLYLRDIPNHQLALTHLRQFIEHSPKTHPWRERVEAYLQKAAEAEGRPGPTTPRARASARITNFGEEDPTGRPENE